MKALLVLVFGLWVASASWSLSLEELQVLIDQAPQGQTVIIPAGTYQGELVVGHPMVLRAQPGAKLVHSSGTSGPTLWIQSDDVTVVGLEIEGSGEGTRRDHTAVLVSGSSVTLWGLKIQKAWSGVWLDHCVNVTISDLEITGLKDFPFWERGEGVRVTEGTRIRLQRLRLTSVADGIDAERSTKVIVDHCAVQDARYGLHLMFSSEGEARGLVTSRTVAGVMVMESSQWTIRDSHLTDGYRTGSAGIREIRTKGVRVLETEVARQASGIELLDVRGGLFHANRITENGIAWTWGGDNSGTLVQDNTHRGNLIDFAGGEPTEKTLVGTEAHNHGAVKIIPTVQATALRIRPIFDRNYWDGWTGTDLDQDGVGDTPYRFDAESAVRFASHPWVGVFLGSPWSQWSRTVPGGEVIDEHPRTRAGG